MNEAPLIIKDFLNYMETIKGKSKNTVHEYFYDLRTFLRFMKIHKGLVDEQDLFVIDISDVTIDLIRTITLSDLYAYMSYVSRERDNNANSRARKVASIKSFCQNYQ
jgi:integrase/recombinase XerD